MESQEIRDALEYFKKIVINEAKTNIDLHRNDADAKDLTSDCEFAKLRYCMLRKIDKYIINLKTENKIMERIIKQNGLWEDFLNDDEFIKYLEEEA